MSIAQKAASGAAWNVATSLGTRVLSVAATLALAHYLSPHEYGTVIGATIVTSTCVTVTQFGLTQYLVVKHDAGPKVAFHVLFYTLSACLLALGLVLAAEGWMSSFFNVEDLQRYFPWLAGAAAAECVSIVPERILARDLRFRLVALTRAAGDLTFAFSSVALAAAGLGGMSLIYASVLRIAVRLAVYSLKLDLRVWAKPCALDWPTTRAMFAFGLPLTASVVAGSLSVRWDNMVFAHYFGAGTMGAYNYAYSLSEMPVTQIGEQIGDVLLPSFARMTVEERRDALGRSMALLGLIIFPLAVGLAAVADSLVRTIFDPKWSNITPMLTVLAVLAVTRPISYVVNSFLQASGRVVIVSVLEVVKVIILFSLMVVAAPYGILVVCVAVGGAFLFHSLAGLFVVTRDGLPFWATLLRILRPLFATVPMAAAVVGLRLALARTGLHLAPVSLALEIVTGAVVFVVSAFAIAGDTSRELVRLARAVVARRRGEGDASTA